MIIFIIELNEIDSDEIIGINSNDDLIYNWGNQLQMNNRKELVSGPTQ